MSNVPLQTHLLTYLCLGCIQRMFCDILSSEHYLLHCRKTLPAEAFQSKFSNMTDIVRVWDFYSPDYNCPLLKERVGEPFLNLPDHFCMSFTPLCYGRGLGYTGLLLKDCISRMTEEFQRKAKS